MAFQAALAPFRSLSMVRFAALFLSFVLPARLALRAHGYRGRIQAQRRAEGEEGRARDGVAETRARHRWCAARGGEPVSQRLSRFSPPRELRRATGERRYREGLEPGARREVKRRFTALAMMLAPACSRDCATPTPTSSVAPTSSTSLPGKSFDALERLASSGSQPPRQGRTLGPGEARSGNRSVENAGKIARE